MKPNLVENIRYFSSVVRKLKKKHFLFTLQKMKCSKLVTESMSFLRMIIKKRVIYWLKVSKQFTELFQVISSIASTLQFLDRKIILNEQKEQIDLAYQHCLNFSNITESQYNLQRKQDTFQLSMKLTHSLTKSLKHQENLIDINRSINKKIITYKIKKSFIKKVIKKNLFR